MSSKKHIEEEEDEEEEVDNDFQEEEGDEDEEEAERARQKKRRKVPNFIAEEAEEDDEDDEEDEDEDELDAAGLRAEKDFVDDSKIEYTRPLADKDMRRKFATASDAEIAAEVRHFEEKYGSGEDYDTEPTGDDASMDHVASAALQPTSKDPNLWLVRCRAAKKKESSRHLALALMRKFVEKQAAGEPLEIMSVVACDHIPGYLYVEAYKKDHVIKAIDNMDGVYKSSVKLVPLTEMVDVLTVKKKELPKIQPGSWVRLRRGAYTGDLAEVIEVDLDRGTALVRCVPRIDVGNSEEMPVKEISKKSEKRKRTVMRPAAQLFSRVMEDHPKVKALVLQPDEDGFMDYKGDRFKDGFLYKQWNLAVLSESVTPTLDELQIFQGAPQNEDGELGSGIQNMLSNLTETKVEVSASWFKKGDAVEVGEGEMKGLVGTIEGIEGEVISVVSKDGKKTVTSKFQPSELRRYFEVGNHVKVINGKFEGESGMLVRVEPNVVTLVTDSQQKEIQVFAKDVQKADERSTGMTSLNGYFLHDFVNIDAANVGVVIRVEKDSLRVLDQLGTVRMMKPQELTPRKNAKNAVSLDRLRNNIKVGDAITITEGAHKSKQGKILHLNRNVAFILSQEIQDNQGVVAVSTFNMQLVGTSVKRESQGFSMPAQRQALPAQRKDDLVSKVVSVTRGPWKGHQGTVKAVNDNIAQVELHSRPKPIPLDKSILREVETGRPRGPQVFAPAEGSRTPAYAGSQTPAYNGGRTPMYGSRTPGYEGGATPGYEGGRTPAWDAGSRTPSAYHTPASWNDVSTPSSGYTPVTPGNFATTPAETPSTPYGVSYDTVGTPSTPTSNYHYTSTPHTPSHVPGTPGGPTTPGGGFGIPRTPGGPTTPGPDMHYDDWVVPGLEVVDAASNRQGQVKAVAHRMCNVLFLGEGAVTQVNADSLLPLRPSKNDTIRVIRGDHKGEVGTLLNIEGMDGIVKTPDWNILSIDSLCKYTAVE